MNEYKYLELYELINDKLKNLRPRWNVLKQNRYTFTVVSPTNGFAKNITDVNHLQFGTLFHVFCLVDRVRDNHRFKN